MKMELISQEFLELVPDAAVFIDQQGHILLLNNLFAQMFGYEQNALLNRDLDQLFPPAQRHRYRHKLLRFLARRGRRPITGPLRLEGLRRCGAIFPMEITINRIESDQSTCAVAHVRDASQVKNLEEQIRRELEEERLRAKTDDLTGLANRRAFIDRLHQAIAGLTTYETGQFSVCFIDIDDFKAVNDRFGHRTGDAVLQTIARHLKQGCRKTDFVARIGGDELATIHPGADSEAAARAIGRIRDAITDAMADQQWPVTLSVGICHCDDPIAPLSVETILHAADAAMYAGKQEGKNQIRVASLDVDSPERGSR